MWEKRIYEKKVHEKFVRSFLDIIVMVVLDSTPAHGYEIMAIVHKEFGVLLSPGTLYPLLHSLEDNGLIEASYDDGKIVYRINSKGKQKFKDTLKAFSLSVEKMSYFIKARDKEIVLSV
jgi:PadR family transcriptional regulator PadR